MLGMKPFGALGAGGRGGGGLGRRAALFLDFVNGMYTVNRQRRALADIMTIAGGVNGTRVNSAGLIEAATRTNLLAYSNDFTQGSVWSAPEVTAASGNLLSNNAGSTAHQLYQLGQTIAAGAPFSGAVDAQYSGTVEWLILNLFDGTESRAYFNLRTGVKGGVAAGFSSEMVLQSDGYYRCSIFGPMQNASVNGGLSIEITTADGLAVSTIPIGEGVRIKDSQFEQQPRPTAYIETGATAVTATQSPRFDYDPVTLAARGVLIEEQRTNSILNGDTLDGGWSSDGTADLVLNQTISPTGAMTASQLQYVTNVYRYTTVATADATPYSYSLYPTLGTGGNNAIRMDVPGGGAEFNLATVTATPDSGDTASIADAGDGWYRSVVNFDTSSTSTLVGIVMNGSFAAGQGHYFWGAQLEAGPFATSYIPTTGSAATRSADNLTMTGTDFSSWWNQTEGTIVVKFDHFGVKPDDGFMFSATDVGGSEQVRLLVYAGVVYLQVVAGGVSVVSMNLGTIDTGPHTLAVAYKANDFAACLDGGAVVSDTSGAVPAVDRAGFGRHAASNVGHLNGHLQAFAYEPRRLSNSMLQSLS